MIIVDEASQMFVAEALPVIYRAKKLVVSGDKMQMPPTDDFSIKDVPDDDEDELLQNEDEQIDEPLELMEKMENIVSTGAFRSHLRTHYRSRPAELFNFSNHAFYNGMMQIPPDNIGLPAPLERPIKVIPVEGEFLNSINKKEISQIISLLREIWSKSDLSVGVVVFNEVQRAALEDALWTESESDEDFKADWEKSRTKEKDEEDVGFFVRSIQKVQGDERDVIILGTTYGKKSARLDDRLTREYGKLNYKNEGRRMLNVAITRAKMGMYVVSSLNIDDVADDEDHPGGNQPTKDRWYLWKFLQYARAVSDDDKEHAAEILCSLRRG